MGFGERIKKFIETCYETQSAYSELSGINRNLINRYIQGNSSPKAEVLAKMLETGVSVDWLLQGTGSMFASNEVGYKLKEKYLLDDDRGYCSPIKNIKYWIELNYYSIRHFCVAMDYNFQAALNVFENNHIIDDEFFIALKKAGCNTQWLIEGVGDMYTNDLVGQYIKSRREKRKNGDSKDLTFEDVEQKPFFNAEQIEQLAKLPKIKTILDGADYERKNDDK